MVFQGRHPGRHWSRICPRRQQDAEELGRGRGGGWAGATRWRGREIGLIQERWGFRGVHVCVCVSGCMHKGLCVQAYECRCVSVRLRVCVRVHVCIWARAKGQ